MTRDHEMTAGLPGSRSNLVRAALLAGCAVLLAGCYTPDHGDPTAYAPVDYRLRYPIVVKEKDSKVELFVGNSRGSLNDDQRADVVAFARVWRREATGGIVVETPTGTANAAAAAEVARETRAMLVAAGVPSDGIAVRSYRVANPGQLATVRLKYPRMAAEAGPCGLWPIDVGPTTRSYLMNNSYWNHGCASQRNLAAMVANPADLAQPRGEGPPSQMRRSKVLTKYENAEPTWSPPPPGSEAAKISNVGR
jgi:pilus assembly protein CpaD